VCCIDRLNPPSEAVIQVNGSRDRFWPMTGTRERQVWSVLFVQAWPRRSCQRI